MKIYRVINNPDLDLSLVKALAREGIGLEHVEAPEEADVLVIFEKGRGFGVKLEDVQELLGLDKPKVLVSIDGGDEDEKVIAVRPVTENGKLKVKMSQIVEAVKHFAPPEFEIQDDTEKPEEALLEKEPPEVEFVHDEPPPGGSNSLRDQLERALSGDSPMPERSVSVVGVKSGVGVTTLCACLTHALAGLGAAHVDPSGTGYVYYGGTVDEALAAGNYFTARPPDAALAILDSGDQGDALVAVIDDSIMSFQCLKGFLENCTPDMVVINRVRGGVTDTVFRTEFPEITRWCTVIDNYDACIKGQNEGKPPTLFSPDMARDIGKMAAKVRELLGL